MGCCPLQHFIFCFLSYISNERGFVWVIYVGEEDIVQSIYVSWSLRLFEDCVIQKRNAVVESIKYFYGSWMVHNANFVDTL